jgi:hypothetical protein
MQDRNEIISAVVQKNREACRPKIDPTKADIWVGVPHQDGSICLAGPLNDRMAELIDAYRRSGLKVCAPSADEETAIYLPIISAGSAIDYIAGRHRAVA